MAVAVMRVQSLTSYARCVITSSTVNIAVSFVSKQGWAEGMEGNKEYVWMIPIQEDLWPG